MSYTNDTIFHLISIAGGIPNVVAAGKAVLKDWNRSVEYCINEDFELFVLAF